MLKYNLELLLLKKIPIQLFMDSKSLFGVLISASATSELHLMIDIYAKREANEKHEIADIV